MSIEINEINDTEGFFNQLELKMQRKNSLHICAHELLHTFPYQMEEFNFDLVT